MQGINKIQLLGHIGAILENKVLQSGQQFCSFTVATSDGYTNKQTGEWIDLTQWHIIKSFNPTVSKLITDGRLLKGARVYLEGKVVTEKYTGQDGIEKQITKVEIPQFNGVIIPLEKKEQAAQSTEQQQKVNW